MRNRIREHTIELNTIKRQTQGNKKNRISFAESTGDDSGGRDESVADAILYALMFAVALFVVSRVAASL